MTYVMQNTEELISGEEHFKEFLIFSSLLTTTPPSCVTDNFIWLFPPKCANVVVGR